MSESTAPDDLDGFQRYELDDSKIGHSIYKRGAANRPAVVLLHELPGMAPECVELALELSAPHLGHDGYQVHMPLLFGSPNETSGLIRTVRNVWCMRHELRMFASGSTSPITKWLGALVNQMSTHTEDTRTAVIGMCLTGGLVFGLLAEPDVVAAVASQPALPFALTRDKRRDLGLSEEDRDANFGSDTPLMALRYRSDLMCPRVRFRALANARNQDLPPPPDGGRQDVTVGRLRVIDVPGRKHSVLTIDRDGESVTQVKQFLASNLG